MPICIGFFLAVLGVPRGRLADDRDASARERPVRVDAAPGLAGREFVGVGERVVGVVVDEAFVEGLDQDVMVIVADSP
jgi:hypothetical protein